jgi:hypothetical protein
MISDPVEEDVAVSRLPHRTGGHRPHGVNTVAIDDAAEIFERRQGGIDGLRSNGAAGKCVATEQYTSRCFLDGSD